MQILLNNRWLLTSDSTGYILKEFSHIDKKNGKIVYIPRYYYTSFKGMLNGIIEEKIKSSTAKSLEELRADFIQIKAEIKTITEQLLIK